MPSKGKNKARKEKEEGRKESEILLSVRTQTSQADILHVDQRATKLTTCKQLSGKF